MHVMVGLRRRFCTFCDFALVSKAISPSRNPYHIATRWMVPSAFSDANDIVCFPRRNSAISSSVIRILPRWLTPFPISAAAPPFGRAQRSRRESDSITQAGLVLALDLDRDEHLGLDAGAHVGDLLHLRAGADALPHFTG